MSITFILNGAFRFETRLAGVPGGIWPEGARAIGARIAMVVRMNRITVISDNDSINAQAQTYAEYRVFAVLARHVRRLRLTHVVLGHMDGHKNGDTATCAVTVELEPSESVRIRETGPHVYAAINRAVERLDTVMARRVEERTSS